MNLDCANATSLFELGFGLSAVLAAIAKSEAEARGQFMQAMISDIAKKRPDTRRETLEDGGFEAIVLAGFPNLQLLFRLSFAVRLVALIVLVASVGTLLQNAFWGTACKIERPVLNNYIIFAFVGAPVIYWHIRHRFQPLCGLQSRRAFLSRARISSHQLQPIGRFPKI